MKISFVRRFSILFMTLIVIGFSGVYFLFSSSQTAAAGILSTVLVLATIFSVFTLQQLVSHLNQMTGKLTGTSEQVELASQHAAETSAQLSQASAEQAAGLQQTMATIEQISTIVGQNSQSAQKTKEVVDAFQSKSDENVKSVDDMLSRIYEIQKNSEKIVGQMLSSNDQFSDLTSIISEMAKKTKVIDEIVFQTRILSFNAAIEAARAGEHGKGFAVVAEEIGNLAQMSGTAAQEISKMLAGSVHKVNLIVEQSKTQVNVLADSSSSLIQNGIVAAEGCKSKLSNMAENAQTIAGMMSEIALASQEQAQGIQEISKAFIQIDQATQQNAVTAQNSSAQAEYLQTESHSLTETIQNLILFLNGQPEATVNHESVPTVTETETENVMVQPRKKVDPPVIEEKPVTKVVQLDRVRRTAPKVVPASRSVNVGKFKKASGTLNVPKSTNPNFEEF